MSSLRRDLFLMMTTSVSTAIVVASLTVGYQAWANLDQDDATDSLPRVVPYEGVIDFDGSAYNGTLDMKFTLYDAASGGSAVWTEDWTADDQRAVQVFSGRFAAALGTFDDGGLRSLEDVIADAGPVYLGVEVKESDDDAWVALSGRQRLNPVPYALWSNKASDLDVAGTLTVTGGATLGGANVNGALAVTGNATIRGAISDDDSDVTIDDSMLVANHLWLRDGTLRDSNGDLTIDDNLTLTGTLSDSNSNLAINDNVDITGTLTVSNNLGVEGILFGTSGAGNDELAIDGKIDLDGDFELNGSIFDNNSDVIISDGLVVTGSLSDSNSAVTVADDLVVTGNISDSDSVVNVNDDLTVTGDVSLSDCRICFNTRKFDGGDQHHACVKLIAGQNSGWADWNVDINDNDDFGLAFLCDGGGNSTGRSNVGM